MGDQPMPSKGLQQLCVTVDGLTQFSRNLISPLRVGTGTSFPCQAMGRGGGGRGTFSGRGWMDRRRSGRRWWCVTVLGLCQSRRWKEINEVDRAT
jgi:hypothetical protein